ncbi:Mitochondrial genome maintenance protein [Pseudocercospora fuligena]|uniref:Mitochondrial genome maintenance protein MGM101 n=1 Tax=Pseudocercospora fuligena TaxID=685502 RepID=A0A8H6VDV2_9PEZI|nr:Mitochondrial genome maintenance protein [Pseudocercospora fuligena]
MSTSRRAGSCLASIASASSCRVQSRCARHIPHAKRVISTTPRRWQQAAPKTPSSAQAAANTQKVQSELSPSDESEPLRSLTDGLQDPPPVLSENEKQIDWTRSFHGLSSTPFTPEQAQILQEPLEYDDVEIKPDGIVYLPEIKYRRKLNRAFGPGGWGLAPRGETIVTAKVVTREYGLVCGGRLVSIARGEQQYFDPDGIPTATEGCKSNALMRCCKDLGIASELWDPRFIKKFMSEMGKEIIVEHQVTKKRRKHFMRKDDELRYPFKEIGTPDAASATGARPPGTKAPTNSNGNAAKSPVKNTTTNGKGVASAASQAFQKAKTEAPKS